MKPFFTIFFVLVIFKVCSFANYLKVPKPVDYVDVKKFSGLWYEIARTYNSFEKNCVAATVEYKLIRNLKYKVRNRCFDKEIGGKLIEYNGTATPTNKDNMSKIDMTYFWIFTKEYRIIYLQKDYLNAVMVDENMQYVWIMSRKPNIERGKLKSIETFLSKYMDISKLIYTPQDIKGKYK